MPTPKRMESNKSRLVLLPVPCPGHLISMVEMAKSLLLHRRRRRRCNFSITVLVMRLFGPDISEELSFYMDSTAATSDVDIDFEFLPEVDPPPRAAGFRPGVVISMHVESYKAHVKDAISRHLSGATSTPIAAFIMDFFATSMIDVAKELGVPPYVYFSMGATMLGLMLYLPKLEAEFPVDHMEDVVGGVDLPGIASPVPPLSMPDFIMNKKHPVYDYFVLHGRRFLETKGLVINTFAELQPYALSALEEDRFLPDGSCHKTPPVYPVGPVLHTPLPKPGEEKHECIKWLDKQPPASVVFLCFGSNGSFSAEQTKEIARGLENSGHRFLWCIRGRNHERFGSLTDANLEELMLEGFMERTKERGLVWPTWAPQVAMLSHEATGGFVTHCGWNSCMEGVLYGVPMLGWPLYAEQHMNGLEMAREMGVALELKIDRKRGNFVVAEELERGVSCLMEEEDGKMVRKKVKEMREKGRRALEDGGSSMAALERLGEELVNGIFGFGDCKDQTCKKVNGLILSQN